MSFGASTEPHHTFSLGLKPAKTRVTCNKTFLRTISSSHSTAHIHSSHLFPSSYLPYLLFFLPLPHLTFFLYDFQPLIMQTPFQLLFHYQSRSDMHMPASPYLTYCAQWAWAQKSLFIPALSLIYPLCALNAFIISRCWSASMWSEYQNTFQGCM